MWFWGNNGSLNLKEQEHDDGEAFFLLVYYCIYVYIIAYMYIWAESDKKTFCLCSNWDMYVLL